MTGPRPPGAEFYQWRAIAVAVVAFAVLVLGIVGIAAYVEVQSSRPMNHPISGR